MKHFLIIGFGSIGCRHAQSLSTLKEGKRIHIVEPNKSVFKKNLELIGLDNSSEIILEEDLNSLDFKFDLCVIATTSLYRFNILKSTQHLDIQYYLLEKVVFQSKEQFDQIMNTFDPSKIFVNFVNRYYSNYISLKKHLVEKKFSIDVIGGDFGLGCNVLHYLDLFCYLGAKDIMTCSSNLNENLNPNKRGSEYREVHGQISFTSKNGCKLNLSSDLSRNSGVDLVIKTEDETNFISQSTRKHSIFSKTNISNSKFNLEFTSSLTSKIYRDMQQGNCLLPTIDDTSHNHLLIFNEINKALNLNSNDLCPIT